MHCPRCGNPTAAVLQAEGGISRVLNPHFAACKIPRPAGENAGLRDDAFTK